MHGQKNIKFTILVQNILRTPHIKSVSFVNLPLKAEHKKYDVTQVTKKEKSFIIGLTFNSISKIITNNLDCSK